MPAIHKECRHAFAKAIAARAFSNTLTPGDILQQRHALYCQAQERNPRRWSGNTRNWTPIGAVMLNPERDAVVEAFNTSHDHQPMAA